MSSSSGSTPSEDDWKKITKLVDQFFNRPDSEPFREPVDWKSLGLLDYPKIVAEPMDLGTVKKKLQKKEYKTLHQVGLDVRKIWSNCQDYNQEGSDFHKLAGSLRKKWDDRFTKLLAECRPSDKGENTDAKSDGASSTNNKRPAGALSDAGAQPPTADSDAAAKDAGAASTNAASGATATTLAERKAFAKSLFSLSKEDLGKLLVDVEAKCPAALTRNAAEDEVELNVDKLSSALLMELSNYVANSTAAAVKPNKATSGGGTTGGGAKRTSTGSASGSVANSNKRTKTSKA